MIRYLSSEFVILMQHTKLTLHTTLNAQTYTAPAVNSPNSFVYIDFCKMDEGSPPTTTTTTKAINNK